MFSNLFKKVVEVSYKFANILMTIFLIILMSALLWQVFTRFIIKVPSIWTEELARYAFIYMAIIGASLGVKNSEHFSMTIFTDKLKGKKRNIYVKYVINVSILISSIILFKYGLDFSINFGFSRVSPTFLVPMFWVFLCVPLGALLMMLFSIYNIVFGDFSKDEDIEYLIEEEKKIHNNKII